MSPVAINSAGAGERLKSTTGSDIPIPYPTPVDIVTSDSDTHDSILDTPARRPSPWHDIAHSLSTTALPQRRSSASFSIPASLSSTSSSLNTPNHPSPPLSTSQALREWEERLARPTSAFSRHALLTSPSPITDSPSPKIVPKLEPERDKEGHIEYKLKLINPSGDRFERLVTQMMWRLKQGRNEAIYELGLADDGTVVGLSRADMDASLRTLELMASEVGATVLVLKEIVLAGSSSLLPIAEASASTAKDAVVTIPVKKKRGWGRKRRERRDAWEQRQSPAHGASTYDPQIGCSRRIVFDPNDIGDDSDDEGVDQQQDTVEVEDVDEDVPTFHLDLEDPPIPPSPAETSEPASPTTSSSTGSWKRRKNRTHKIRQISEEERLEQEKKATTKAAKSMARRESRRLDLLRGDGMSPGLVPDLPQVYPQPSMIDRSLSAHPHAPTRPSSLRLATPSAPNDVQSITDESLDDLLTTPLDSLSLSFADVQTVRARSLSSSSSSSTEYAPTMVDTPILGNERICVEALVVRKVQHEEEEDGWGWGGMDDVWGLSAEGYEASGGVEAEVAGMSMEDEDGDDSWGF